MGTNGALKTDTNKHASRKSETCGSGVCQPSVWCPKGPHSFSGSVCRVRLERQGRVGTALRLLYRLRGLVNAPSSVKALSPLLGEGECPGPLLCFVPPFPSLRSLLLLSTCSSEGASHKWSSCFHNSSQTPRHPTISSSVVPFYSCLQSFPASGSFPVSQFFTSGASASASVLPMNIQD